MILAEKAAWIWYISTDVYKRQVLLRQGNRVGDVHASELEDQGKSLVGFVKDMYCYQSDRVARALAELDEKGE